MGSTLDRLKEEYRELAIQKKVVRARIAAEHLELARQETQDAITAMDREFGDHLRDAELSTSEKQEVIRTKDWSKLQYFVGDIEKPETKSPPVKEQPRWVYEICKEDTELWFQPHDYLFNIVTPEGDHLKAKLDYYHGDFRVWDKDVPNVDWREFNRVFRSDYRAGRVPFAIPEFDRFLIPQEDEAGEMLWLEGEADAGV